MNPQMQQMMRQAQKLQEKMAKAQEELALKEYEFASGGDMVKVKVNGKLEVLSIKIGKEVIDPTDPGLLEDLIHSAINGALKLAQDDSSKSMNALTGGMKIPGFG